MKYHRVYAEKVRYSLLVSAKPESSVGPTAPRGRYDLEKPQSTNNSAFSMRLQEDAKLLEKNFDECWIFISYSGFKSNLELTVTLLLTNLRYSSVLALSNVHSANMRSNSLGSNLRNAIYHKHHYILTIKVFHDHMILSTATNLCSEWK